MPDGSDKIYYSDIIAPDESLDDLIKLLSEIQSTLSSVLKTAESAAKSFDKSLSQVSSTSSEASQNLARMAASAEAVKRTSDSVKVSLASCDQAFKNLKTATDSNTAANKNAEAYLATLKKQLESLLSEYNVLTEAEKANTAEGGRLLAQMTQIASGINVYVAALNLESTALKDVEKAQQRLKNASTAEGAAAAELQSAVNTLNAVRRESARVSQETAVVQERLNSVEDEAVVRLRELRKEYAESNRITQLNAQIANSAKGSYEQLSAQLQLAKIEWKKMSAEARDNEEAGKALEKQIINTTVALTRLDERQGVYTRSVGNYNKVWNSFGYSVAQVVRELPSLAIGFNTFFLAISNNLPILADEIARVRKENKALAASGEETVSVAKRMKDALFSWNTGLVLIITLLTIFGQKIIDGIKNMKQFRGEAVSVSKALSNIAAELKNSNDSYGENRTKLQQLSEAWRDLKDEAEKTQWIMDNTDAFEELGLSITSVDTAEDIFVANTDNVIRAFQARAMAAAAQKLAQEQYQKQLEAQAKADRLQYGSSEEALEAYNIMSDIEKLENKIDAAADIEEVVKLNAELKELYASLEALQKTGGLGFLDYLFTPTGPVILEGAGPEDARRARTERWQKAATGYELSGDYYANIAQWWSNAAIDFLGGYAYTGGPRGTSGTSGTSGKPTDLTEQIYARQIQVTQDYEQSISQTIADADERRKAEELARANDQIRRLQDLYRKNEIWLANNGEKGTKEFKEFTKEQEAIVLNMQANIQRAISNIRNRVDVTGSGKSGGNGTAQKDVSERVDAIIRNANVRYNKAIVESQSDAYEEQREQVRANSEKTIAEIKAQMDKLREYMQDPNNEYLELTPEQMERAKASYHTLAKTLTQVWLTGMQDIREINYQEIIDSLQTTNKGLQLQHDTLIKGSEESLRLALEINKNNKQIALMQNAILPQSQQVDPEDIEAGYNYQDLVIKTDYQVTGLQTALQAMSDYNTAFYGDTAYARRQNLKEEQKYWEGIIKLYKSGESTITEVEAEIAEAEAKRAKRESGFSGWMDSIASSGLTMGILSNLKFGDKGKGFDVDAVGAFNDALDTTLTYLQEIFEAQVELAEKEVELAEERTEAAQSAYEAEVEARNNGYANSVATARMELDDAKANQAEKEKLLEEAERKQEAVNTALQVSSLITATAQILAAYASLPFVGQALAIAAISSMWATFIGAKIMAATVTSQQYGEGGLEFLEGGSHASGHDIPLGYTNSNGAQMRAEGGEALAIVNKKQTKKYKKILPDIVDSLNKGVFEDRYMNAFSESAGLTVLLSQNSGVDLSQIEDDVKSIKKQNETRYYVLPNGSTVMQRKNVKRIIKK